MADTKISALSAVTDVLSTDEFVLARSGTTKKIAGVDLATAMGGTRNDLVLSARGLIAETIDEKACNVTSAPGSGVLVAGLVGLRAGDVITNVAVHVVSNGTGVTLAKVGIYDVSGNLLASSADVDTSFTSGSANRKQVTAFSSPYTVVSDGGYYLAVLFVGGTSPTILRANTSTSAAISGSALAYGAQGSLSDLPDPMTLAAGTNSTWLGAT